MPVLIAGIGTAVPPHRIAQAEAAAIARQYSCETPDHERVFNAVYWGTGVETRHSVVLRIVERRHRSAAIVLRRRQPHHARSDAQV